MKKILLIVIVLVVSLSGCASITSREYIDLRDRYDELKVQQELHDSALKAVIFMQQEVLKWMQKHEKKNHSW